MAIFNSYVSHYQRVNMNCNTAAGRRKSMHDGDPNEPVHMRSHSLWNLLQMDELLPLSATAQRPLSAMFDMGLSENRVYPHL